MMIKVHRRYECDTKSCDSSEEEWVPLNGTHLPEHWRVVAKKLYCPRCEEVADKALVAAGALREEQRAASLERGQVVLAQRARQARQVRIAKDQPRPGDIEAEDAAVAAET